MRIEAQGVAAARPFDQRGGEDPENEDHAHDDRRHDVMQNNADLEPEPVERCQQVRPHNRDHEEERRERKRPKVRSTTLHQGPKCNDRKDGSKNEAKGAVRGGALDLAPVEVLVYCSHSRDYINLAATEQPFRYGTVPEAKVTRLNEKIAKLRQDIQRLNALNAQMMQPEEKQISLTDPDARSMATSASRSTVWAPPSASAQNATRSQTSRYRPRQR
jgi:hypothetical protein